MSKMMIVPEYGLWSQNWWCQDDDTELPWEDTEENIRRYVAKTPTARGGPFKITMVEAVRYGVPVDRDGG